VCTHKPGFYLSDGVYLPIHVGKAISPHRIDGIATDDRGDQISARNGSFCELTALYWAWKNLPPTDFIGLCHYRRYFNFHPGLWEPRDIVKTTPGRLDLRAVDPGDPAEVLKGYDIVLTRPTVYPYNLKTDYALCHMSEDLRTLQKIVHDLSPGCDRPFDEVLRRNNRLSHYNMFLTRRELFDDYCTWLFAILFEAERRIDIGGYNAVQRRIFGYMGERLLNVYCRYRKLKVRYLPVYFIEKTPTGNYTRLGGWFKRLRRDFQYRISKM